MNLPSNSTSRNPKTRIGIRILSPRNVINEDENEFAYEPAKIIRQDAVEIYFEIDHPLPLGSIIAVKARKDLPGPEATDEIYKVERGKVQNCVKMENSTACRYEICIRIFEKVLQTKVAPSRFDRN